MFINKAPNGTNNLCGKTVTSKRRAMGLSQRALADSMQLLGLDLDKNAIQRIEAGKRYVTDIELSAFAHFFKCSLDELTAPWTDTAPRADISACSQVFSEKTVDNKLL